MMKRKIVIACDSYKGCLTSLEVNEAVAVGLRSKKHGVKNSCPEHDAQETVILEMSDGGEGMLNSFLSAMPGERISIYTHDALMRRIEADYGIVRIGSEIGKASSGKALFAEGDEVAVIEIAQTVGLALVEPEQRNPMKATSWGVGEMILHAYRHGIRRFIVGLGGSATSDCGIGMLRAMGDEWKTIRPNCTFVLASDVTNPLYGEKGAAHVFAPQKGADAEMVDMLDERARRFADVSARHFGIDKSFAPGAGAAGGLGYAFMQYLNAECRSGADLLLDAIGFDEMVIDADLVITGEGHSDQQTLMGKMPQRVLEHVLTCRRNHQAAAGLHLVGRMSSQHENETKPQVWLVSGGASDGQALRAAGFDRVVAVTPEEMPLHEALKPEVARRNIVSAIASIPGN